MSDREPQGAETGRPAALQRIGLAAQLGLDGGTPPGGAEAAGGAGEEPRAPETDTERLLVEVFSRVLEAEGLHARSDFFALGGDSLSAGQLIQELAQATGVTVPVYEIFDQPRVAQLAAFLDVAERGWSKIS